MTVDTLEMPKATSQSLEEYRLTVDELEETRKKIKSHNPSDIHGALESLHNRYQTEYPGVNSRPVIWPEGTEPSDELPTTIITFKSDDYDKSLDYLKHDVQKYYPDGVELVEITFEDGGKGVALKGISARDATAIDTMIIEECELKLKMEALLKQQYTKETEPARTNNEDMMSVPTSLDAPEMQKLVKEAMSPDVPTNQNDYSNGKVTTPDMQNLAKTAMNDFSLS